MASFLLMKYVEKVNALQYLINKTIEIDAFQAQSILVTAFVILPH